MTEDQGADSTSQAPAAKVDEQTLSRLDALEKDRDKKEVTIGKQERLISTMQRRSDTLERQLNVLRSTPTPPRGPRAAQAAAAAGEDHTDRNESLALRTLMEQGLTEEDLPKDLDLATASPAEVRLSIALASTQKQLQQLGASNQPNPVSDEAARLAAEQARSGDDVAAAEGVGPAAAPGAGGLFDAGGPTGTEADKRSAKVDRLHVQSEKLLQGGNRQQGAYLKLRAIHNDPRRVVSGGETDDLDSIDI